MSSMTVSKLADGLQVPYIGEDVAFTSFSTDTRSIEKGVLFIALQGEHFDGHDYVEQAVLKGAAALMVSRQVDVDAPQLLVDDTRIGLGQLASFWRQYVDPMVVALTGSNGKTTLKEMLSAILSIDDSVLATKGNLNNDIGVPLTLLSLKNESMAVVEMGANHVGEIDYLTRIANPDVAILNNAGRAHIGEFGSEENIARTKAEILNGLKEGGVFIYHADSQWVSLWQSLIEASDHKIKACSFGVSDQAEYVLDEASYKLVWNEAGYESVFSVSDRLNHRDFELRLKLAGKHNAMNALAAVAVCLQMGKTPETIQQGLASLMPVRGRLYPVKGGMGQLLVDDSYNANPESVMAAIDILKTAPGRRALVLGDLAELGEGEVKIHADLGRYADSAGIDVLYGCGPSARHATEAFNGESHHFADISTLTQHLLSKGDAFGVMLIKGSRSSAMDQVVDALTPVREAATC